jgi:site-specific recombinase XerD
MSDLKQKVLRRVDDSYEKYGWTEDQREVFDRFIDERIANYKNPWNTLKSYVNMLNHIVKNLKKPFSQMTYEDLIPVLKEWQENHSESSVHGRKCKLKAFFRWESGNKDDPRVRNITSGSYVSPITLDDLLTEGEIKKLREAAREDPRNLAMVDFHLLWGPRPAESAKLKISNVEVTDRYIVINIPETKTIYRPVPIPLAGVSTIKDPDFLDSALNAFTSLMAYLNRHPGYPHKSECPLWFDKKKGPYVYLEKYTISRIFRRLGKEAGLEKPVSTYTLRRTAFNRFNGVDREKLCAGFGWKPGSRMPTKVYNKLRPQDHLKTLIEEEPRERNIIVCPQCAKENPGDKSFCVWCGATLKESLMADTIKQFHADQKAQKEFEEMRERLSEMEKMMKVMVNLPGFDKLVKEAAEQFP